MSESLGFVLRLEQGRGVLGLARICPVPFGCVEDLVLELPDLRYPFDLSTGVGRFRDRRTRLEALALSLGPQDLLHLLDRPGLAARGLRLQAVRLSGRAVHIALEARLHPGQPEEAGAVPVTVRGTLAPAPHGGLRVQLAVPRVFGELPVAAPLLAAGWSATLAGTWVGRAPALVQQDTALSFDVAARELCLYAVLAARGWRLPERAQVALAEVSEVEGRLRLLFRPLDGEAGARAVDHDRLSALLAEGDAALAAGERRAAEECYRQAAERTMAPDDRRAADRLLAVLGAGNNDAALEREIEVQRTRAPTAVVPLLARAALVARRGRSDEAVALYERVAVLCQAAGEAVDAACAHLAVAALWQRAGRTDAAAASRERAQGALAASGGAGPVDDDGRSPLARARAAWSAGRLDESARLYQALAPDDPGEGVDPEPEPVRAEAHLRLAQWTRLQGRLPAADKHLSRALRDEPEGGGPLETLVEVLEAFGRVEDLVAALEWRRTSLDPEPARAAVGALGEVLERAGRADEAVALYQETLEQSPDDTALLARLAEIFRRESRVEDLVPVLERLFALAADGGGEAEAEAEAGEVPDPEAVGLELAGLVAESGDAERAVALLRRVLELRPQSSEARAALAALDRPAAGTGN